MKSCFVLDLMMNDEITFQNEKDEKEWTRLFPPEIDTVYESLEFIKRLFIITLSTISSNRKLFSSDFYAQKRLGSLNVQLFDHHCTNVEQTIKAAIIFDWIGGISQAIAEKYLKMASFIIVSKDVEQSILETFLFLFSYHDENTDNHHEKNLKNKDIRKQVVNSLTKLILFLDRLTPIKYKSNYRFCVKLEYYDNTPCDYEPKGFVSIEQSTSIIQHKDLIQHSLKTCPKNILVEIKTDYHKLLIVHIKSPDTKDS
ncbi:unnamed protein product [Didymodactylos carnosus]|uniref:HORMA domain-containing protein n=1 Tax=Didymodactylos carnosus TaxID=1234261 RepID=A0A814Q8S5_9BILA|nr:unnamed protein product [Didymodactylos carnosus]CAF1162527.1 unnamed protein product [Didymodactylos carnosus]CAF3879781.1 unnamed protein product [Didymodactylos carnosus]CAF3974153.1 unnamed protein product [Didymodactylos carnosus]